MLKVRSHVQTCDPVDVMMKEQETFEVLHQRRKLSYGWALEADKVRRNSTDADYIQWLQQQIDTP